MELLRKWAARLGTDPVSWLNRGMRRAVQILLFGCVVVWAQRPAGAPGGLAREILAGHNEVRHRIGLAPLTWSPTLAAYAQEWANHLIARGQFAHRQKPRYGENLYEISGASASPREVVGAWADEYRDYDYATNRCRGMCGHYTQIVWADTKSVGCAVARERGREVWVCNYDPPGNWVGQRPYGRPDNRR